MGNMQCKGGQSYQWQRFLETDALGQDGADPLAIDGHAVEIPHSCGGDGNEHRYGDAMFLSGSPGGIALFV